MSNTWNGLISTNWLDAINWSLGVIPDLETDVEVPGAVANMPVVSTNETILSLQVLGLLQLAGTAHLDVLSSVFVDNSLTLDAGAVLTIDSQFRIDGTVTNNGDVTISNAGALVASVGSYTNNGTSIIAGGLSTGTYLNEGTTTLSGDMLGAITNNGIFEVTGMANADSFQQNVLGSLLLDRPFSTDDNSQVEGDVEFVWRANSNDSGRFSVGGMASIGLDNLTITTDAVGGIGGLSAGFERALFSSAATAVDAFSVDAHVVTGQVDDFSYVLGAIGIDTFVGSISLIALNSGTTGGHAALDMSAATRAVTADINLATGDGTITGGRFATHLDSLFFEVDEIVGSSLGDSLTGTGNARAIFRGGEGNDVLTSSGGNDSLFGDAGNDTLNGNNGNDTLSGGANNDRLNGGTGSSRLDGGTGIDTMVGGTGNDVYIVDHASDLVSEAAGAGLDTILSSVTRSLMSSSQVERLVLTGTGRINATGNSLANTMTGNSGNNGINGKDGKDVLTGGLGSDTFVFDTRPTSSNYDRIVDFDGRFDFLTLDDAAFKGIGGRGTLKSTDFVTGTAAKDASDRVIYDKASGKLYYDDDGSGAHAKVLFALVKAGAALTSADIIIF